MEKLFHTLLRPNRWKLSDVRVVALTLLLVKRTSSQSNCTKDNVTVIRYSQWGLNITQLNFLTFDLKLTIWTNCNKNQEEQLAMVFSAWNSASCSMLRNPLSESEKPWYDTDLINRLWASWIELISLWLGLETFVPSICVFSSPRWTPRWFGWDMAVYSNKFEL